MPARNTSDNKLVLAAISNTSADYFKRPQGSFVPWLKGQEDEGTRAAGLLKELARDQVLVEVTDEVASAGASFGKCRYYQYTASTAVYMEAASLVKDLSDEELAQVRLVRGHHGFELQAPLACKPTNLLTICIGHPEDPGDEPTAETAVVFCWYPGKVTPAVGLGLATVKLS